MYSYIIYMFIYNLNTIDCGGFQNSRNLGLLKCVISASLSLYGLFCLSTPSATEIYLFSLRLILHHKHQISHFLSTHERLTVAFKHAQDFFHLRKSNYLILLPFHTILFPYFNMTLEFLKTCPAFYFLPITFLIPCFCTT